MKLTALGTRIALLSALLLLVAIGVSMLATWWIGSRIATQTVNESLAASQSIQSLVQDFRGRELELLAAARAADPSFSAYIAEATLGGLDEEEEIDYRSILDLVSHWQRDSRLDFAMVLDDFGYLLVRTDRPQPAGHPMTEQPLVDLVVEDLFAENGLWRERGRLYQAAVVPIDLAHELIGFIVAARALDEALATELRRASGAEVAFLAFDDGRQATVVGSTLAGATAGRLAATINAQAGFVQRLAEGQSIPRLDMDTDAGRLIVHLTPLIDAGGELIGAVATLASLDAKLAGFRQLQTTLILLGLSVLLAGVLMSLWLARRVTRPLTGLAEAADNALQGEYRQEFPAGGGIEIQRLAGAFRRLLSDLREQREMQSYVADLSRHLPEQAESTTEQNRLDDPPDGRVDNGILMAVDARVDLRRDGERTLAAGRRLAELAERLSSGYKARLIPGPGARVTLAFGGEDAAVRAVKAAGQVLKLLGSDSEPLVAAMSCGDFALDRRAGGGQNVSAVSGKPALQLDVLLSEAGARRVLLSPAAYQRIKAETTGQPVLFDSVAGRSGRREFMSLIADPKAEMATETGTTTAAGTAPSLVPGQVLSGRYEVLARVGSGGMGTVFRAHDRKLDDVVALKILHGDVTRDAMHLQRLQSEIRLARRISHPNVLRTHDFGEADGLVFISMEYVRGLTLRYLLGQSGRLSMTAGLRLVRQVCLGLQAAHEVGILHRDIKPENLILDPAGNAKLMDFGIARQFVGQSPELTQEGSFVGTPNYLAPEVILGKTPDPRTDLYSLGVVMTEVFTGQRPFHCETKMEALMAHVREEPARPSELWPEIPAELEQIILKLLAKDPDDRFRDTRALLAALRSL